MNRRRHCHMWTSDNLGRVDDAFLDEVGIFADVKPVGIILGLEQLADHDRAVTAGSVDNLLGRCHEGAPPHDVDTGLLIVIDRLQIDQRWDGEREGNAHRREGRPLQRPHGLR